tara:strand:+ start:81253 stop:82302 length:1050 start_codon:yes stop_codon:yes gene_type:complete
MPSNEIFDSSHIHKEYVITQFKTGIISAMDYNWVQGKQKFISVNKQAQKLFEEQFYYSIKYYLFVSTAFSVDPGTARRAGELETVTTGQSLLDPPTGGGTGIVTIDTGGNSQPVMLDGLSTPETLTEPFITTAKGTFTALRMIEIDLDTGVGGGSYHANVQRDPVTNTYHQPSTHGYTGWTHLDREDYVPAIKTEIHQYVTSTGTATLRWIKYVQRYISFVEDTSNPNWMDLPPDGNIDNHTPEAWVLRYWFGSGWFRELIEGQDLSGLGPFPDILGTGRPTVPHSPQNAMRYFFLRRGEQNEKLKLNRKALISKRTPNRLKAKNFSALDPSEIVPRTRTGNENSAGGY